MIIVIDKLYFVKYIYWKSIKYVGILESNSKSMYTLLKNIYYGFFFLLAL